MTTLFDGDGDGDDGEENATIAFVFHTWAHMCAHTSAEELPTSRGLWPLLGTFS